MDEITAQIIEDSEAITAEVQPSESITVQVEPVIQLPCHHKSLEDEDLTPIIDHILKFG